MSAEEKLKNKVKHCNLVDGEVYELIDNVKKKAFNFYQFYNIDFSAPEYSYFKYLEKFKHKDDLFWDKKILNKTYYDIETKYDPKKAPDAIKTEFPITSVCLYNNIKNLTVVYFLVNKSFEKHRFNEDDFKKEFVELYHELIKENSVYEVENMQIELKFFESETQLLKEYFQDVLTLGTLVLIGFNSMIFDDPYTINRLSSLIGKDKANMVVSQFILKRNL